MPSEPVSVDQLKAQLRITHNEQDSLLALYLVSAREQVEQYLWRMLVPTTVTFARRSFPPQAEALLIPYPPLRSVTSIGYVDTGGNAATLTDFRVDTLHEPGSIEPLYGQGWPPTQDGPAAVTLVVEAGYADVESVPMAIKHAILLLAAEHYRDAEPMVITGRTTLDRLLSPYRVRSNPMLETLWTPKAINPRFPLAASLWFGPGIP